MLLLRVLSKILNHPLNRHNKIAALFRFLRWQVGTRLIPYPVVYSFTEKSKIIVRKGMMGATGNLYCGLDEFNDMGFLLHYMRPEDVFVDVGANIGSYTILASGHVGCKSIAVEPNSRSFDLLSDNLRVNNIDGAVRTVNVALGGKAGVVHFTNSRDTVNHVATSGDLDTVETPVDTLDHILAGISPSLLKVDVEGYEYEVFEGGNIVLQNTSLKAIIVELVDHGKRYGFSNEEVHINLLKYDFTPCSYDPFTRKLQRNAGFDTQNTLYIRDFEFVTARVSTAPMVEIHGIKF